MCPCELSWQVKWSPIFLLTAPPPSSPIILHIFIDPTKVTSYLHIDINEHGQDMGGESYLGPLLQDNPPPGYSLSYLRDRQDGVTTSYLPWTAVGQSRAQVSPHPTQPWTGAPIILCNPATTLWNITAGWWCHPSQSADNRW